jgi:hypothetical protein
MAGRQAGRQAGRVRLGFLAGGNGGEGQSSGANIDISHRTAAFVLIHVYVHMTKAFRLQLSTEDMSLTLAFRCGTYLGADQPVDRGVLRWFGAPF